MLTIEANNLFKQYKGSDTWAVRDVSFGASQGEVVGLVGENGAGKSTLLRMLATMLKPSAGRVSVAGFDAAKDPSSVRRSVGILFGQQNGLYERLTARENILYFARLNGMGRDETRRRLPKISAMLEMEGFLDLRAGTFSTGMRQKTLIARSIIHDPAVLMLDEPASGLDVTSARNIHSFIKWCRDAGKTVIFSSHDLHTVERISDRVLLLRNGLLTASGPPAEITGETSLEELFFRIHGEAE